MLTTSNVFGGPIAAGILETMEGVGGLRAWKWCRSLLLLHQELGTPDGNRQRNRVAYASVMLIEGAISILVGIAAYFSLPNWANNTPWMSPEETEMAQYRIVLSAGGHDENDQETSLWQGTKLALRDPFTYIFCLMHLWLVAAQSFKDFLPSIVSLYSL